MWGEIMSSVPEAIRPIRKLLRAVAELHVRGYQRIRIVPYFYEIGTWRCTILPAIYVSRTHGASWVNNVPEEATAKYSSATGREYWGWRDDHHCSPAELADVFLAHFPRIAELGYGQDWLYVGWYQHMLHLTYPDGLPICWNNQQDNQKYPGCLGMLGRAGTIPPPPPGYAVADQAF